jgi:predicted ATP-grasp superfamily ATP-dependent carboligase
MTHIAKAVGVSVPYRYGPSTEATAARTDIRYPVVVKPNIGHLFFSRFGCKLFIADNQVELLACIRAFSDAHLSGQVLDLVPGPDSQIYTYGVYMDAHGEPIAGITVRKLRQSPPFFGVARVAEIAEDNDILRDSTVEMLRRIGYRGIAVAEFKLDPRDGKFRFLEFNGRSVVYNGLQRFAGVDLNRVAWADFILGRPERTSQNSWRGVWINLHADLLYSTIFRRYEGLQISDYLAPYRRPKTFAVWSTRDPMPYLRQWSITALKASTALSRGEFRDILRARVRHGSEQWHHGAPVTSPLQRETTDRNLPPFRR